jgi:hypothetical protein
MPSAGDVVNIYNRQYKFIKPSGFNPGAYRLATPAVSIPGSGGGGTSGPTYNFDGEDPIVVNTVPSGGIGPNIVKTSLDIQRLPDRTI